MQTTARRNISIPSADRSDRPDIPLHIKNVADKVDVDVLYDQGTETARQAASHQLNGGRFWWCTDTKKLWYDDGTNWLLAQPALFRKNTAKAVINTITETDLLNNEITLPLGVIGTTGIVKITAWGEYLNNSGAAQLLPRFKLKMQGTTLIDTNVPLNTFAANASVFPWKIEAIIENTGAQNAQAISFFGSITPSEGTYSTVAFATGQGRYACQSYIGSMHGTNTAAVDTSASCPMQIAVINGVANANYSTTLRGALFEVF